MSDTIAACATGSGTSLRAMIRVSGSGAHAAVDRLSTDTVDRGDAFEPAGGRRRRLSLALHGSRLAFDGRYFRAPNSYTGEDVVELTLPGVPAFVALVLDRLAADGVRPAEPGEFTRRACLNGRLDLATAEGIDAMIRATDDAERRGALTLTSGVFSGTIDRLREGLTHLLADLEASIDFMEHEVDPDDLPPLSPRIQAIADTIAGLERHTAPADRPPGLADCLLWGRPNAGKSTLFNRLIGRERVKTGDVPGMTRDVIAGRVVTPAGDVQLLDAPGVGAFQSAADRAAQHIVEGERERAALRLVIVDPADAEAPPPPGAGDWMLVVQKSDRPDPPADPAAIRGTVEAPNPPLWTGAVSARTGAGLDALIAAIGQWLEGRAAAAEPVVAAARLHAGLRAARAELDRMLLADADRLGAECLAVHARTALDAVDALVGAVPTEALLDAVFSRFCIGK